MAAFFYIRPLHFVDIICDYGSGIDEFQPHPFGHGVHVIANQMIKDKDTLLEITLDPDDVCRTCVHNIAGVCDNIIDRSYRPSCPPLMRDWDLIVNKRYCERLGIAEDDRFTARQLCERIRDRMGDITELFPEFLDDRATIKAKNLAAGVRKFLA